MSAVAASLFAALFIGSMVGERVILKRAPAWFFRFAIPLGKPRVIVLPAAAKAALVELRETGRGDYRAAAEGIVAWKDLDAEELGLWLSESEYAVRFLPERALLAVTPRSTLGRNRGVWASFFTLRYDGGSIVLTHRFFLGDIAWMLAFVAFGVVWRGPGVLVMLIFVAMMIAMRVAVTYYQLQDMPADVQRRFEAFFETPIVPVRIASGDVADADADAADHGTMRDANREAR